jgi:hypothetical protein
LFRDDGLSISVKQLLQDPQEAMPTERAEHDAHLESVMGAPSSGMWPQFNIRFGGGPIKSGALGFNGSGQISYQGDTLKVRGNRRNKNLGMSKQEEQLPVQAIARSLVAGEFIELYLHTGLHFAESIEGKPARLECATHEEALEMWELLNMGSGQLPRGLSYARTASGELS